MSLNGVFRHLNRLMRILYTILDIVRLK